MKRFKKHYRTVFAIGLLAFIAIFSLFFYLKSVQTERIQNHFHEKSREAHQAIKGKLELTLESLAVIQSLFENHIAISRNEFQKLAASVIARHPSIEVVEWIPRVTAKERKSFERAVQNEGFLGFGITQRLAKGQIVPDIQREEYFPVNFLEPLKGNEVALGYNLGSDPSRRKALDKARESGEITATEAVALAQETKQQKGFLLFLPVYKTGVKESGLHGYILAVFKIKALTQIIAPSCLENAMEFSLYDITNSPKELLLQQTSDNEANLMSHYDYTAPIEVADRIWQLHTWPSKAAISQKEDYTLYWLLISALTLFFWLLYLFYKQLRQSEKINLLSEELADAEEISRTGRWKINWQEQTIWMSGILLELYGLKESQLPLPVANLLERIHPDDREGSKRLMEESLGDGELHTTEFRFFSGEKTLIILIHGKMVPNPDGTCHFIVGTALDVTTEREREQQVRFNEKYLEVVFDTEPDLLLTTNSREVDKGNIAMLDFTGYEDIESFKKDHHCICDLFEEEEGYLQSDMGEMDWLEYIYAHPGELHQAMIKKEGSPHVFSVTANRLLLDEKKRSLVVLSDITELNTKNKALRQSQQLYQDLVEHISDWVWEIDTQGRYSYCSPKVKELLGYEPEEVIGKSPFDLMLPEEAKRVGKLFAKTVCKQNPILNLENTCIHKNGSLVILETSGMPIFDSQGKLTGYRGIDRDITERIRTQEALKEQSERAELYLNTAQIMLLALDSEGTIVLINPKGCEILGYEQEELVGKNWFDLCIPEGSSDTVRKIFEQNLERDSESILMYENEIIRKNGTKRLIRWNNAPLINRSGGIIGTLSSGEDITERKESEERLKLFRTLLDHSLDGIEVLDPETLQILDVNEAECLALGYSREALLSMTIFDIDPGLTPERAKAFEVQMQQSTSFSFESKHRRKDGSTFPVEVSATLVELDRPYILSIARDVTERHQAEKMLIQNQQKYKELVENISDWVWETDVEGRFTYLSPKARELLGYEPDELLGKTLFEQMQADEAMRVRALFAEKIRTKAPILNLENTLIHKNGTPVIMETSGVPILDALGNLTGYRGVDRDVTERKKSEAVLHHFMGMIDQSNDTIFLINPEGKFVDVNQAACRTLGYTREELLTMGVLDISPDQSEQSEQSERPPLAELIPMIMEQGSMTFEARHIRKDGSEIPVEISVTAEEGSQEGMMIAVARDITERKEMAQELHKKDELMIAQSRQAAMGDMIAMIAHQWRQPITVIAMAANNIKVDIELEEEITTDALLKMTDTVTEQTQHLSKTIDDFRNFFKPKQEQQVVTLCKVLEDTLNIVGKSLENSNIRIEFSPMCQREISTFPNELLQVFLNLISNAKDALIRKESVDAVIYITIEEGNDEVRALICDNGDGIPEEIFSKIGQPYFTTKEEGGTGLGLYMSKTIVEKHLHGKLSWKNIESEQGHRACFIVSLPMKFKAVEADDEQSVIADPNKSEKE